MKVHFIEFGHPSNQEDYLLTNVDKMTIYIKKSLSHKHISIYLDKGLIKSLEIDVR